MPRVFSSKKAEKRRGLLDNLKFGESYTSLILGIIVVIVGTVLLLSLVRTRSDAPQISSTNTSQNATDSAQFENGDQGAGAESQNRNRVVKQGATYTVQTGDTLWNIAESAYKSGYKWTEIARANKLSNPDSIEAGMKLSIPEIEQKIATTEPEKKDSDQQEKKETGGAKETKVDSDGKITGNQYTVKAGDSLWEISVRAYGDGYKWSEIAKANKLANPDLIHPGNKFTLPRK
jgi:nucleoid-associated protein YgaU